MKHLVNPLQSGDIGFVFHKRKFWGFLESPDPKIDFGFIFIGLGKCAVVEKGKLSVKDLDSYSNRKVVFKRREELSNSDRSRLLWYIQSYGLNKQKVPNNAEFISTCFDYICKPLQQNENSPGSFESLFNSKHIFEVK